MQKFSIIQYCIKSLGYYHWYSSINFF